MDASNGIRRFIRQGILVTLFCAALTKTSPDSRAPLRIDLAMAIRIGTANHFALLAASNKQLAIRKLITERWRAYLPSADIAFTRSNIVNIGTPDSQSNELRLTIEQVIYDGGRRDLDMDLANIDQILARDEFRVTYNQVRIDIQKTYLQALAAKGKIVLNEKSMERARLQLHEARREESLGFSTHVQVLTVAARLREIELALSQARDAYRQAMHNLKLALNLEFETPIELDGDIFYDFFLRPPNVDLDRLIRNARARRPEMAKAETMLQRLKKEKEMAENAWIPKFSINGYVGRTGTQLQNPPRQPEWGVGIKLTFPLAGSTGSLSSGAGTIPKTQQSNNDSADVKLFDDISYDRKVLESRIALGQGIEDYNTTRTKIPVDVAKAYDKLMESWDAIRIGNGRTFFQFEGLRIVQARGGIGDLKRSEIVLQETELVRAQQDLDDAIANYMVSAYELEFSAGQDPGTLRLFDYRKGAGNTLLPYLVRSPFQRIRERLDETHKGDPVWEMDKLDNEKPATENDKKDRFLIDQSERKK